MNRLWSDSVAQVPQMGDVLRCHVMIPFGRTRERNSHKATRRTALSPSGAVALKAKA